MSTGISYDWDYARERERRRVAELRAELEELRVREQALTQLYSAARVLGIQAERPRLVIPADDANSATLEAAVTAGRSGLDAFESRLRTAIDERSRAAADEWMDRKMSRRDSQIATVDVPRPAEVPKPEPRVEDAATVAARAEALLAVEQYRCAEADLPDLRARVERIRELDGPELRVAFDDLRVRVRESVSRRATAERAQALRAKLLHLTGAAGPRERARLRRLIQDTADADLPRIEQPVREAVEAYSRARERDEVTLLMVESFTRLGYSATADVIDVLRRDIEEAETAPVVLPSTRLPGYGVRISRAADGRIYTSTVRRDDLPEPGPEATLGVQESVCEDIAAVEAEVADKGIDLHRVSVRMPNGHVPTMAAKHWAHDDAQRTQAAMEHWRQQYGRRPRAKGGAA